MSFYRLRVCLHEGGGPQVGEITCGGSPHLSNQIKMRDNIDRGISLPKRVTSPTLGPPSPCKQATGFDWFWAWAIVRYCLVVTPANLTFPNDQSNLFWISCMYNFHHALAHVTWIESNGVLTCRGLVLCCLSWWQSFGYKLGIEIVIKRKKTLKTKLLLKTSLTRFLISLWTLFAVCVISIRTHRR